MTKIAISIKDCSQCPHSKIERVYTADSFENVHKWTCNKERKVIDGYVDTFDKVAVPNWCPIVIKDDKK
jgi:hypothetical protein